MNLDEFKIAWLPVILFFACIFGIFLSFTIPDKKNSKINLAINSVLAIFLLFDFIYLTYLFNYKNSGYSNIAKITLHICTKDNKTIEQDCEYIGAITYRPYLRELMITTKPLYPILNCPNYYSPNCKEERIFVDKGNVKSLERIE